LAAALQPLSVARVVATTAFVDVGAVGVDAVGFGVLAVEEHAEKMTATLAASPISLPAWRSCTGQPPDS
jgi:hypothetical protein